MANKNVSRKLVKDAGLVTDIDDDEEIKTPRIFLRDAQGLSRNHQRFAAFYIGEANGNATRAALLAGYASKSAGVTGSRLLKRDDIKEVIEKTVKSYEGVASLEDTLRLLSNVMMDANDDYSIGSRLKAADQLAKVAGYYHQTKEQSKDIAVDIVYPAPEPVEEEEDLLPEGLPDIEFPTFHDEEMEGE